MRRRDPSFKRPDSAALSQAIAHIAGMKTAPVRQGSGPGGIVPEVIRKFWRFVGPIDIKDSAGDAGQTPTTGRVNAVAFDPARKATWYAGSSNGGVWKTTDSGTTWVPISDSWPLLYVSSIAVDKSGKNVYAGTGDCPLNGPFAIGVMKSHDAGKSWHNVSDKGFRSSTISRVAVDPDSADIVLAADFNGFLWRSKDGGKSWKKVNPSQTGWVTVDFGAKDSAGKRTCYAMARDGKYVYVSKDRGATWKRYTSPVGSKVSDGRPQVAASPHTPGTVYLYSPDRQKIWRNTASGSGKWKSITGKYKDNGEASYCFCMACSHDPALKSDVLYVGQYSVYRSVVGSGRWSKVEGDDPGHADMHALAVCPSDPTLVLIGNDGGAYSLQTATTKSGSTTITVRSKNKTLVVPQVYQAGCSVFGPQLAGMQDTGSAVLGTKPGEWVYLQPELGGDGGGCAISVYFTQFATANFFVPAQIQLAYSVDGWKTWKTIVDSTHPMAKDPNPAVAPPMVIDPYDPSRLYVATTYLYRWTQKKPWKYGGSWKNRLGGQRLAGKNTVQGLAIGSSDGKSGNRIYTGGYNGQVWMSDDAGKRWRKINGNLPAKISVGAVSVNPTNADDLLIVLSVGNPSKPSLAWRCKKTTDKSPKWEDVGGPTSSGDSLPATFPLWAVTRDLYDPVHTWYAGGAGGLFFTNDAGAHWYNAGHPLGLPNAPVYQLQVVESFGTLVATTFGRGIYVAQLTPAVKVTSLKITPSSVRGGTKASGTVKVSGAAPPLGLQVYLTSGDPASVKVPPAVKIDAGKKSAAFSISTKSVTAKLRCTVKALYGGTSKSARLTVTAK